MLYFHTLRAIFRKSRKYRRADVVFATLSSVNLSLVTIFLATFSVFGQEMWILHPDYPGGSAAYLADNAAVWYQTMGSAASVVLNLMSDGLLVWSSLSSLRQNPERPIL